jgi:SRSO17 transposase
VRTTKDQTVAAGHSIDPTRWQAALQELLDRIAGRFARVEPRRRASAFVRGLLADLPRKNCWTISEHAGDPSPDGMQHLLSQAVWDADAVRDEVRDYVIDHLADPEAVLVIDETGDLKKGTATVGVQRQYTGTAGKIDNAQVAVYLVYAAAAGHAVIDRELYLPKGWTADADRRAGAGVPEQVAFATKPELARVMLERAGAGHVPAGWVTADEVYGGDARLRAFLEQRGLAYVLAVKATQPLWAHGEQGPAELPARQLVAGLPARAWRRLSAGDGAKGPRLYDWAYCELADLDAGEYDGAHTGLWTRGLLIRRSLGDGELAFFSTWCPAGTGMATLVEVEGHRWAIEDGFETAKTELGLDHNETRSWHGWHRHVSLVMLAFAMLAAIRRRANERPPPKTADRAQWPAP